MRVLWLRYIYVVSDDGGAAKLDVGGGGGGAARKRDLQANGRDLAFVIQ